MFKSSAWVEIRTCQKEGTKQGLSIKGEFKKNWRKATGLSNNTEFLAFTRQKGNKGKMHSSVNEIIVSSPIL